jgi:lipopolysaccharide export LptBFGC system permease protein LptF
MARLGRRLYFYIFQQFGIHFLGWLLSLSSLVVLIYLVEKAGTLTRNPFGTQAALRLTLLWFVENLYFMAPLSVLLAVATLGNALGRRGELLALGLMGYSPYRLLQPLLVFTAMLTFAIGWFGEAILPQWTQERIDTEFKETYHHNVRNRLLTQSIYVFVAKPYILYFPHIQDTQRPFTQAHVFAYHDHTQQTLWHVDNLYARTDGNWILGAGYRFDWDGHQLQRSVVQQSPISLKRQPDDFLILNQDPQVLQTHAIQKVWESRRRMHLNSHPYAMIWYQRWAHPMALLACLVLAYPQAFLRLVARPLAFSLVESTVFLAGMVLLSQLLQGLALAHRIPLWLGGLSLPLSAVLLGTPQFIKRLIAG